MCVRLARTPRRRISLFLALSLSSAACRRVCVHVSRCIPPRTEIIQSCSRSVSLSLYLSLTHSPAVPVNITEFIQNDTRCATLSHDRLNPSAKRTLTPSSVIKVTLNYRESGLLLRAPRPLSLNLRNLWKHASCASQKDMRPRVTDRRSLNYLISPCTRLFVFLFTLFVDLTKRAV